jgi:hypothetical protein
MIAVTEEMLEDESSSSSSDSGMSFDEISPSSSKMIATTIAFGEYIYESFEDTSIDFNAPRIRIPNLRVIDLFNVFSVFGKVSCRKWQDILWQKMSGNLPGDEEKVICTTNRFTVPYESRLLLLVLFRLASPPQLSPEMETSFRLRKSHIASSKHDTNFS